MSRTAAKAVLSAALALTLGTGQLAFAQGNSNHNRNDRDEGRQYDRGNSPKPERHDNRDFGRNHNQERDRGGRGVGPNHGYYRGDRLPAEYRHRNYVVSDWRGHHLSAPPRGHQWVQSGSDYILVAIATGVIVQLMMN